MRGKKCPYKNRCIKLACKKGEIAIITGILNKILLSYIFVKMSCLAVGFTVKCNKVCLNV